jgi:hypothetical protein
MTGYPIFSRTMAITIPAVATVPILGLAAGAVVGIIVAVLIIRGLMQ